MRDFLGLQRINETSWRLHVTDRLITPGKFLFSGCGLASGVVALEEASGRPTIYAAAHYLSFAPLDADVDVVVNLAVEGRRVTQARATASVKGREVLTVNAALGTRELTSPTPWLTMPEVPAPEDCPERTMPRRYDNSIFNHIETRIALGRSFEDLDGTIASPVSALWARVPSHLEPSRQHSPSLVILSRVAQPNPWVGARWDEVSITPFAWRLSRPPSGFSSRYICTLSRVDLPRAPGTYGAATGYCSAPPVSRCRRNFGIRRQIKTRRAWTRLEALRGYSSVG